MKLLTGVFLFLMMTTLSAAEPPVRHPRVPVYDVLHYQLALSIDERNEVCAGIVSITLRPLIPSLDRIHLDAVGLRIDSVKLGKAVLHFGTSGDSLLITLDRQYSLTDTLTLSVGYESRSPEKGLYFIRPDSAYPHKQWQVWSQGESEENRYWFPCYDYPNDKATSEMIVTVNDRFMAISNGRLVDVKRNQAYGTTTYHWRENLPHVSYLISLVVGEYVEVRDGWGTIPIIHYVPRRLESSAMRSFANTPRMMEYFSTLTGFPYPWEKYGHAVVQDFIYLGQENVSVSTLTDATLHDARAHLDVSSDGLVAHELAHQWWGDLVSFSDWSHLWLSEGFATYFDFLFQGYERGNDEFLLKLREAQQTVVAADRLDRRRPTVTNRYENPSGLFDSRVYQKGACVLQMLRMELGDELFWSAIRSYVKKFAFKNATTTDFLDVIRESTGQDPSRIFDEYLYHAGYPEFVVNTRWDSKSREVVVAVKQAQQIDSLTGVFTIALDIEVWVHGEPETYRIKVTQREEEFRFPAYQQPQLVLFDKGSQILKSVMIQKSIGEWTFQLAHAEFAVDRIDAAEELRWLADSSGVQNALVEAMLGDRFWAVRREAAWALADAKRGDLTEHLAAGYGDRDARVRAAVVSALGNRADEMSMQTLLHAFEHDSSYYVVGAALRALVKLDSVNGKTYCQRALKQDSHQEVVRIAALYALGTYTDDDALGIVKEYTRYGIDRNVRVLAITILARNWKERDDILRHLIPFLRDPGFHVRRATIDALASTLSPKVLRPLQDVLTLESDARLVNAAQEAIKKIKNSFSH